mgnify:CR=1 FL=1
MEGQGLLASRADGGDALRHLRNGGNQYAAGRRRHRLQLPQIWGVRQACTSLLRGPLLARAAAGQVLDGGAEALGQRRQAEAAGRGALAALRAVGCGYGGQQQGPSARRLKGELRGLHVGPR